MKNKILVISFIMFVSIFSIFNILIPDKKISESERRELKEFPKYEPNTNWIKEIDKYFLDHFILRDTFRSIKAHYNYNFLNKLDNNGIFTKNNYIFKSNYPTNKDSVDNFKKNINKIINELSENNKVYIMIIPDKNYYINSEKFLLIDYNYIYSEINEMKNLIDLREILSLNDYYETDTHWKQEKLNKVIKKMSEQMNFEYKDTVYTQNIYNGFYGVYHSDSAIKRKPEKLVYLTNETIRKATVNYLENKNLKTIYNEEKLTGLDSYEVYLDGASSYIEIINNSTNNENELIIFRDSFGSSIAPLLIDYYKKITLIDNRYITSENFKKLISFENQDVLFLYSTLIINNSYSLKG